MNGWRRTRPPKRLNAYEVQIACTGCGTTITVGPFTDDLEPSTYRGVVCGCRKPKPRGAATTGRGVAA